DRRNSTKATPSSLYQFIVCKEQSRKILREMLGFGIDGSLLEQTLQKEFHRVGTQLDWAIELLRDGKDMVWSSIVGALPIVEKNFESRTSFFGSNSVLAPEFRRDLLIADNSAVIRFSTHQVFKYGTSDWISMNVTSTK
ncbi:13385_t:CDS:2, partial [Ambispora gerdemannii]